MPKKSQPRRGKGRVESGSDDEGSQFNDTASMVSIAGSEASTIQDENLDDTSVEDAFETKMKDAMDLAGEKSAATRIKGIEAMCQGMLKRYVPDFIENRRATIADIVEKSVKKGKGAEVQAAARLAVLLGLQLLDAEEVYKDLRGPMLQIVCDSTQSPAARAAVVPGLAGLCFIAGGELAEVVNIMKSLETIFTASLPKQDGSANVVSPEVSNLHTAALSAWALLSTLLSPGQIYEMINSRVAQLRGILTSSDVDLRIAAGETMVLLLESVYEFHEDFEPENFEELISELKQLATDSSKSKSKKDRKEQRSSFREVLRGVEEGEPPSETVKFGREVLHIDSWLNKCRYDWFCRIMGTGLNFHLSVNYVLREVFELGAPNNMIEADEVKLTKTQRNAANQQAFKARTQLRSKNRDKRSAVV